jgi:hypothetical protein
MKTIKITEITDTEGLFILPRVIRNAEPRQWEECVTMIEDYVIENNLPDPCKAIDKLYNQLRKIVP